MDIIYLSYALPFLWCVDADIAQPVWKGAIAVGDDASVNDSFHTLVLSNKSGETGARITAVSDGTEFVLVCYFLRQWVCSAVNVRQVAGEPLDQTVFQYGPFVMTSREEIQQTLLDCEYLVGPWRFGPLLTYPTRSSWKEWF